MADDMRKLGSIGVLLPNLQARIVSTDGHEDVDVSEGQPGELWIKGPTILKVRFTDILYSYLH